MSWLIDVIRGLFSKSREIMEPIPFDLFKKPRRRVVKVFLHCSASDRPEHDDVKIIEKWHRERGMNGCGYHYYIQKSGNIQKGRPLERVPAAQKGHNTGSIAICLGGLSEFTEDQFDSLKMLCNLILDALPKVTMHGHKEVANKECPVFDYKAVLGLDSMGRMVNPNK